MMKVYAIQSDTMGRGSDELGAILMASFLRKLWASPDKPAAIVFYNSGVRLLARGATAMDALMGLHEAGVDLVACGTCVTFYELRDSLGVGRISDMQEIVGILASAGSVVTV